MARKTTRKDARAPQRPQRGCESKRSGNPDTIGAALDQFIGTWTLKKAEAVLAAVADFERLDPESWARGHFK